VRARGVLTTLFLAGAPGLLLLASTRCTLLAPSDAELMGGNHPDAAADGEAGGGDGAGPSTDGSADGSPPADTGPCLGPGLFCNGDNSLCCSGMCNAAAGKKCF
jgi:hypothetical protein